MPTLRPSSFLRALTPTLRTCLTRFPVAVAFLAACTLFTLGLIFAGRSYLPDNEAAGILLYYLSVGTVLSLAMHLWGEEVRRRPVAVVSHIAAHALLIADAVFLYLNIADAGLEITLAHVAAVLALGCAVLFVSFFRERNDLACWNFVQNVIGNLAVAVAVGAVMCIGLCLLALSFDVLFGIDVDWRCYLTILTIFGGLLPSLMFMGLMPNGDAKHDRQAQFTALHVKIIRYLFLPLAAGYLAVLYLYAARIIVMWQLPDGWVSWLVVALMTGCIAIEWYLYPVGVAGGGNKVDRLATRLLPVLALPLLLLMTVGIVRRFMDYGITVNRLYLAALNAWFYAICIGLIIGRAKRVAWIPLSFAGLFLLTSALPVNFVGITRSVLTNDVRSLMAGHGCTAPVNRRQYDSLMMSMPTCEAELLREKLTYIGNHFPEVDDLVDADVRRHTFSCTRPAEPETAEHINIDFDQSLPIAIPAGADSMVFVIVQYVEPPIFAGSGDILVPTPDGADTLIVPLETLRAMPAHAAPVQIRTTTGRHVFVPSQINIVITVPDSSRSTVHLSGCLFGLSH